MATQAENIEQVNDEGWETVVEPYADTFVFDNEGDTLIGTYVNKREVEQTGLDGEPREVNVYEITDNSGKKWSVWGSAMLDMAFESIELNKAVKIVYEGTAALDGGRSVNRFTVLSK